MVIYYNNHHTRRKGDRVDAGPLRNIGVSCPKFEAPFSEKYVDDLHSYLGLFQKKIKAEVSQ